VPVAFQRGVRSQVAPTPYADRYFFAVLVKLQSVAPPEVPLPVTDTSLGDAHLKVMLSVSSSDVGLAAGPCRAHLIDGQAGHRGRKPGLERLDGNPLCERLLVAQKGILAPTARKRLALFPLRVVAVT
jgi:hypothetical protein